MKSSSNINEVYNLLSDILGVIGKYPPGVFREASEHVNLTAKGLDRDVLMNVFNELQRITSPSGAASETPKKAAPATAPQKAAPAEAPKKAAPAKSPKKAAPAKSPKKAAPKNGRKESVSAQVKEMREIFADTGFLPEKRDLLDLIRKYFGAAVVVRPNNKDSRRDLTGKAIAIFRKMDKSQQDAVYSGLKADYMKKPAVEKSETAAKGKKKK
jgi:hypothetical protein